MTKSSAYVLTRSGSQKSNGGKGRLSFPRAGRNGAQRRLRQWVYATKPTFARLNCSLAEAFSRSQEVRMVLDLGEFRRGDISLEIRPDCYLITASHDGMSLAHEIPLPEAVDAAMREERLRDGILEVILQRREGGPADSGRGHNAWRPDDSGH